MTYEAHILTDSICDGHRLTTFKLRYPRFIHAEVMTHRTMSRNASSSRAIPVTRAAEFAQTDKVTPIRWGKNQSGMQPSLENLGGAELEEAQKIWDYMAQVCTKGSLRLAELGLAKQWANRPLEWFSTINVVVTATEWDNFFELRAHPDAQDEIRHLAVLMKEAMAQSEPVSKRQGEWHLPFIHPSEFENNSLAELAQCSAARCARTSFLTHDGKEPNLEQDLALFQRLVGSVPLHASPTEHQATPIVKDSILELPTKNLRGWVPLRSFLEGNVQLMV